MRSGTRHTEETKQTISKNTKNSMANLGVEQRDRIKNAVRSARLGKKRPVFSAEWRVNMSKSHKGKKLSEETKEKLRLRKIGYKPINMFKIGHAVPDMWRSKISEKNWTGGRRMSRLRNKAKRKIWGQPSILNQEFRGAEAHHIDKTTIIFIPKELHRSTWHSLNRLETMEQINTKVFCWLLGKEVW